MVSREEVNSLLQLQRESYNDLINHLTSNFNLQLNAIKTDLDHTKAELMRKQTQIDFLQSKVEDFESTLEAYKFDPVPVFDRLDSLEDQSRRNNLRIDGVPETSRETWENTVLEIKKLSRTVGFEQEVKLDRAHRIGNFRTGDRPRTIIARFHNYSDRDFFLRNSFKLRGTRVYINEDLCQASLNKKKEKIPLLHKARSEGKTAYFSHTRLVIKEKPISNPTPASISSANAFKVVPSTGPKISTDSSIASGIPSTETKKVNQLAKTSKSTKESVPTTRSSTRK